MQNIPNREIFNVLKWDEIPVEVREGLESLGDKKVEDIRVYDLREFTPYVDFVILGTVFSSAQARVAKSAVIDSMESRGLKTYGIEGEEDSGWLDRLLGRCGSPFRPETRKYYNLEALWADLPWWPGESSD